MTIPKLWALAVLASLSACNEMSNDSRVPVEDVTVSGEQPVFEAVGQLTGISERTVTIAHGPVPELGWPEMTMAFEAGASAWTDDLAVGDRVSFAFREAAAGYVLISIEKTAL